MDERVEHRDPGTSEVVTTPEGATVSKTVSDRVVDAAPPPTTSHASLFEFRDPVSRRHFIKSVIASGAVVAGGSLMLGSIARPGVGRPAPGAVERLLRLNVNGRMRSVDVLPHETLAMTLRYKLGLTGTKLGCDRGECGACTVLVEEVAINACSLLTHSVRGRSVTTVEGLEGPNGQLHRVQQAMIDELGPQCGFCTSGQVMSAVALLKVNPKPTRHEVRQAMAGNLCRCGAYDHYLNAVMRAAQTS